MKRPAWRKEFEDRYLAFSARTYTQWSSHMRDDHYAQWRIERSNFEGWYTTSHLSAGVTLEHFWPLGWSRQSETPQRTLDFPPVCQATSLGVARRSAMEDHYPAVSPPVTRDWRPLHVALAFLQTRSGEFAAEVEQDPSCGRGIARDLAVRLAYRKVLTDHPLSTVESFYEAWQRLRGWIEDGKVQARGTAVDRHKLSSAAGYDTTHPHAAIPAEQAAELVPWDEPSSDETWLRPDDPTIFGQGRHWKSVKVHWPSLISAALLDGVVATEVVSPPLDTASIKKAEEERKDAEAAKKAKEALRVAEAKVAEEERTAAEVKQHFAKPNVKARKRGGGRKAKYTPAQLEALESGLSFLLDEYGDPEGDNPHPELKSKEDLINKLQKWAVAEKPKDFPNEPARSTIQPLVNKCLRMWRRRMRAILASRN
jgi:hypothetical protein